VDTVGAAGICFRDTPDGKAFIRHAQSRMARIIDTYCTPGSGKWYENPACYYLTSLSCWTTLFMHMAHHGLMRIEDVPRMKEFLQWGVLLLTPPAPDYPAMCTGTAPEAYTAAATRRRISPIGDHARLGPRIPETVALIAACYRERDPAFADLLRWAYHASGADGGYHGQPLLFFANADEWMLTPPAEPTRLPSRRLEGFGAVLRGYQNLPDESFVLLKLGPGGYRYHNTEGSIIFFADGRPLLYDGGEAGETWRHSTLSFHASHTMLAPGHVERFHDREQLGFVQGVNPKVLAPGEPNFLNDRCRPESITTGYQNYHEPNPANSRSLFWVKDQYLLMHDALRLEAAIPSHWHLQVVSDSHTGDLRTGWRFAGRFGTDLQVLMLTPAEAEVAIAQTRILDHRPDDECFSMRHLQVSGKAGTRDYLAVLRPLAAGRDPVQARAVMAGETTVGAHVTGRELDDVLFCSRQPFTHRQDDVAFRGRYAAVLRRPGSLSLNLLDGESLSCAELAITSDGPAVSLVQTPQAIAIVATGKGTFAISRGARTSSFAIDGTIRCTQPDLG